MRRDGQGAGGSAKQLTERGELKSGHEISIIVVGSLVLVERTGQNREFSLLMAYEKCFSGIFSCVNTSVGVGSAKVRLHRY